MDLMLLYRVFYFQNQELEEDAEMRANVNIYRKAGDQSDVMSDAGDDAERAPEIPIEELLEGLTLGSQGNAVVRVSAEKAVALAGDDTDDDRSDILSDAGSVASSDVAAAADFDDTKSDVSFTDAAPVAPLRKKGPAGAAAAAVAAKAASASSGDLAARKAAFAKPAPARKGGRK
jgi:hypothetical protein